MSSSTAARPGSGLRRLRRARRRLLAVGALAGIVAGALATGAGAAAAHSAAPGSTPRSAPASSAADAPREDVLKRELDRLVRTHDFPGALGTVRTADGRVRHVTAGVGDVETRAKVPTDGYVRIGSNTKTYLAVVVLQLVGEGKVELDAPVERYLPKLIRGNGNDGRKITVRMLLNHTSGLPNYTQYISNIEELRGKYTEPYELVLMGLAHQRRFAPGTSWEYSNTGYAVLGLLVQRVTGRPVAEEITKRVVRPLGLKHTYWPGVGAMGIRGPHPRGYHVDKPGAKPLDVTAIDPSWGWAAGQMIGTPSDVNRFFVALLDGELLTPELLKEMRTTVKTKDFPPGWEYGLGIMRMPLSCGGHAWGHGGDIDGYETRNGVTESGRAVSFAVTALPTAEEPALDVIRSLDRALCATS